MKTGAWPNAYGFVRSVNGAEEYGLVAAADPPGPSNVASAASAPAITALLRPRLTTTPSAPPRPDLRPAAQARGGLRSPGRAPTLCAFGNGASSCTIRAGWRDGSIEFGTFVARCQRHS